MPGHSGTVEAGRREARPGAGGHKQAMARRAMTVMCVITAINHAARLLASNVLIVSDRSEEINRQRSWFGRP